MEYDVEGFEWGILEGDIGSLRQPWRHLVILPRYLDENSDRMQLMTRAPSRTIAVCNGPQIRYQIECYMGSRVKAITGNSGQDPVKRDIAEDFPSPLLKDYGLLADRSTMRRQFNTDNYGDDCS